MTELDYNGIAYAIASAAVVAVVLKAGASVISNYIREEAQTERKRLETFQEMLKKFGDRLNLSDIVDQALRLQFGDGDEEKTSQQTEETQPEHAG